MIQARLANGVENGFKSCSKCGESKNITHFHKNKTTSDGFSYYCKECMSDYSRKKSYQPRKVYYECDCCGQVKPKESYSKLSTNCFECDVELGKGNNINHIINIIKDSDGVFSEVLFGLFCFGLTKEVMYLEDNMGINAERSYNEVLTEVCKVFNGYTEYGIELYNYFNKSLDDINNGRYVVDFRARDYPQLIKKGESF